MKLRDRQKVFVERSLGALTEHGNTLGVAPTGAGKTVMMSAIAGDKKYDGASRIIIQHRDELVRQNGDTFRLMNPGIPTGVFDANRKETGYDAVFAMIQTLSRNLDKMPPFDFMGIDEAHHTAADTYLRAIDHFQKLNPNMVIFGTTATSNRGDKKSLRPVFSNCSDQITLKELIESRHLVPPTSYVIDVGVIDGLSGVKKRAGDFDMAAVEAIMDKQVINDKVVEEWEKKARDRQTVVFCSTVEHSNHVCEAFRHYGHAAAVIHSDLTPKERRDILDAYDRREIKVLVNVFVLTEGWDNQPTSCVILLRPSSYKSTMIQMIGRGLRKVEPERYPGVIKNDCIVMDFGTSILMHGDIMSDVNIEGTGTKDCPECQAVLPSQSADCPICGFEFPKEEQELKTCPECRCECPQNAQTCHECGYVFSEAGDHGFLDDFVLTEFDLLADSPFAWQSMFNGLVMIANAMDAWAGCISFHGHWFALGGGKGKHMTLLAQSKDRLLALASADDFLRQHGDTDAGSKMQRWMKQPATHKQLEILNVDPLRGMGMNRYEATCRVTWAFNQNKIQQKLEGARRIAA